MELENRYVVLKNSDIGAVLDQKERQQLYLMVDKIACGRNIRGVSFLKCVVIESDWPEYAPTLKDLTTRIMNYPGCAADPECSGLVGIIQAAHRRFDMERGKVGASRGVEDL